MQSKPVSLILRGIARVSPCKETSPLNCVSGEGSTSVLANTASFSPPRELILTLPRLKALRLKALTWFLLPILLLTPGLAQAQTAPPPSADIQRERVEQLQELLRTKKDLQEIAPEDAANHAAATCRIRREDRGAGSEPGRYSIAGVNATRAGEQLSAPQSC